MLILPWFQSLFFSRARAGLAASLALATAFGIVQVAAERVAGAQDASATPAPTPDKENAEAAPLTPAEKQKAAIALFGEGQKLLEATSYQEAIEKFEKAFKLFADPGLKVKIGEAYQRDGTETRDFDKLRKAAEYYRKFVELVPEGATTDKVKGRIDQLASAIKSEEERIARVADEATQAKLDERLAKEAEEKERLAKLATQKSMQVVLVGGLSVGADQQASGILRVSGGALLSWEKFALEARAGIDGFLRVDQNQGMQAGSVTLIDLGARYGANYRFIGPFVSGGASFGIFTGRPRSRKLVGDSATCGGGDCSFDVDKNLAGRLAFGYGFRATGKSTVALRIEAQGWMFSVDGNQSIGNPHPADVEKPQTAVAIMVGLEFMRWL